MLACIFLSVRAKLLCPLSHGGPCIIPVLRISSSSENKAEGPLDGGDGLPRNCAPGGIALPGCENETAGEPSLRPVFKVPLGPPPIEVFPLPLPFSVTRPLGVNTTLSNKSDKLTSEN